MGLLLLPRSSTASLPVVAAVAGISVGLFISCLLNLRRAREEQVQAEQRTSDARERLRSYRDRTDARLKRLRDEARDLSIGADNLENLVARYEHVLDAIASRSSRTVHHQSATITYRIGERAGGDCVTEEYQTVAGEPNRPLLWCDVRVGLRGSGIPPLRSFRDLLEVVEASQIVEGRERRLDLLPAGRVVAMYRAVALFEPVITTTPRIWSWSYRWDVWNPLRNALKDSLAFEVHDAISYDFLEIRVVFPPNAIDPTMQPRESHNPGHPSLPEPDDHGRPTIVVQLNNPPPGNYSWAMTVREFAGRVE